MARKKSSMLPSCVSTGNCNVETEKKKSTCNSKRNRLLISDSDDIKVNISEIDMTMKHTNGLQHFGSKADVEPEVDSLSPDGYCFLLVCPKDVDGRCKSLLKDVLDLYMKELPAMNYAANTGKESMFLEKCISNGRYCTLLLTSRCVGGPGQVIAAITYQIIPTDTQYAEIPLAAVNSIYQSKGIGHILYMELRKRLQSVGICTVFCWGDKESEGFWFKQGFLKIAEVDTKGRARRLPIKADIRKALCFPGGSTLMVSHLNKGNSVFSADLIKLPSKVKVHEKCSSSLDVKFQVTHKTEKSETERKGISIEDEEMYGFSRYYNPHEGLDDNSVVPGFGLAKQETPFDVKHCSCSTQGAKRRFSEASLSSLKSKRVKGGKPKEYELDCHCNFVLESQKGNDNCFDGCVSLGTSEDKCFSSGCVENTAKAELESEGKCFRIMLMNIADETKKMTLKKVIEDLGGAITSDGNVSTHVVTGKVRKTLNFCTALCSGSWIVSPNWLKESFREGRFMHALPFILQDEDYTSKYKTQLSDTVLRAKVRTRALLQGYDVCFAAHIQPPVETLSTIVRSAGGNVISGLDKVTEVSKTIFLACEEDTDDALMAVKIGTWTFSSDWFMNCVLRQLLDLDAPQFAESL